MESSGTLTDDADPAIKARFCISSSAGLKMITFSVDGDDHGRILARIVDESRPRLVRITK